MNSLMRAITKYPVQIGAGIVLAASVAGLLALRHNDRELVRGWWNTATNTVPALLQAGKEHDAWQLYEKTWGEINSFRTTFYEDGTVDKEEIDRLESVFNRSYLRACYKSTNTEPSPSEQLHELMFKQRAPSSRY